MERVKTICISERTLMFSIAGQLYDQAPDRNPRKADIILQKVKDTFRNIDTNSKFGIHIKESDLYNFVEKLLRDIPEFMELNLTQIEYENGISVDDPSRGKYKFTSAYDVETKDSWKSDFIDLDAFISNVVSNIQTKNDTYMDCFLCKHQNQNSSTLDPGDCEECSSCTLNPLFKINYESRRHPRGKYTMSCKYDCLHGHYICCKECDKKEDCTFKCEENPESCNKICAIKSEEE